MVFLIRDGQITNMKSLISLFCFALLFVSSQLVAETETSDKKFLKILAEHIGILDFQTTLEKGHVVHTALLNDDQLPEEVVAVGAMLLVKNVSPSEVIKAFMDTEIFREVYNVERYQALTKLSTAQESAEFGQLALGSEVNLKRELRKPERKYNLSVQEAKNLAAINVKAKQAIVKAENVWRDILRNRLLSFSLSGVSNIEPYFHSRSNQFSPAKELNSAIKSSTFLENQFPGFLKVLANPSEASQTAFDQQYFWLETEFDDKSVWALDTELRMLQENSAIAADLQYYVSRGYYSMLTFIGVVPYGDQSLVFAINHTYTDAVLGFASGIKKSVGRKQIAESLSHHLELVRLRLKK